MAVPRRASRSHLSSPPQPSPSPYPGTSRQLLSLYRFVARNLYHLWVAKARSTFGAGRVLVIALHELSARPEEAVQKVWRLLGEEHEEKEEGGGGLWRAGRAATEGTAAPDRRASRQNKSSGAFRLQPPSGPAG